MVKLDFLHELTPQTKSLSVVEATETRAGAEDGPAGGIEESMLSYELTLNNKSKVLLNVYVVYSVPTEEVAEDGKPVYTWKLVKRGYCKRGCKGPILKAIQRFGKLGRRCSEIWSSTNYNTKQLQQAANSKDHRFLFISIDEACTHVAMGDKKTRFRLLFSVDDASTGERIGSAVSAPIRVLANNDAPNGAAYINMPVPLTDGWEGWDSPLALRQRTVLPEAMTENAPTTPDGSAGSGASDSDILPGFATKRSRGSNKGAAAAAGRWRAGDAAAGPIHPKKRAKQLAASGILSDASNILITPMSTKVKVEKGSPLAVEGPPDPLPHLHRDGEGEHDECDAPPRGPGFVQPDKRGAALLPPAGHAQRPGGGRHVQPGEPPGHGIPPSHADHAGHAAAAGEQHGRGRGDRRKEVSG